MGDLLPVRIPAVDFARLVNDDDPDGDSVPVVALLCHVSFRFEQALHNVASAAPPEGAIAGFSTWVPLDEKADRKYSRVHRHHPVISVVVRAGDEPAAVPEPAVEFLACASCQRYFVMQLTDVDEFALVPAAPPDVDLNRYEPVTITVRHDPDHLAWVELMAWRRADLLRCEEAAASAG